MFRSFIVGVITGVVVSRNRKTLTKYAVKASNWAKSHLEEMSMRLSEEIEDARAEVAAQEGDTDGGQNGVADSATDSDDSGTDRAPS